MEQVMVTENMIDTEDYIQEEEEKNKLLGVYDYTVVLTYTGMLSAFTGIIFAVSEQFSKSLICLMIAGLCDMFDGTVASLKERSLQEKRFGVQIDSFSDLISFGVLPAVFVCKTNGNSNIAIFFAGFYLLCALIRLAQFNVTKEEQLNRHSERNKMFLGLPVTSSALIFPFVYILLNDIEIAKGNMVFFLLMILMGLAFLMPIKIRRPNTVGKIVMLITGLTEFLFLLKLVA